MFGNAFPFEGNRNFVASSYDFRTATFGNAFPFEGNRNSIHDAQVGYTDIVIGLETPSRLKGIETQQARRGFGYAVVVFGNAFPFEGNRNLMELTLRRVLIRSIVRKRRPV